MSEKPQKTASYRHGDRLVEVADGSIARIHGPFTAYRGLAKLPKRYRAEVLKRI